MKLKEYISQQYKGNISTFANAEGYKRQQVQQCLNKGYYHVVEIEGEMWIVPAKRKLKNY